MAAPTQRKARMPTIVVSNASLKTSILAALVSQGLRTDSIDIPTYRRIHASIAPGGTLMEWLSQIVRSNPFSFHPRNAGDEFIQRYSAGLTSDTPTALVRRVH